VTDYGRRLVHASGALVPGLYLADLLPWLWLQYLVTAGAALALVLEVVRLGVGLDWWVYDRLTREYEADNPAGYAVAVVAAAIVVWAFQPRVAVAAMLFLAIADPVAGVLSSAEGPDTRKSVRVMAVTFGLCLLIGVWLLPARAAVPAAVAVVVADAFKPRVFGFVVDDNFSIPVGAGAVAWLALQAPPLS